MELVSYFQYKMNSHAILSVRQTSVLTIIKVPACKPRPVFNVNLSVNLRYL